MELANIQTDHLAIARCYAAEPYEWPVAPRFNAINRWQARLAEHPDYEVWLLTWLPEQGIELHEHRGDGALYVIRGELVEEFTTGGGAEMTPATRRLRSGFGHHFVGPYAHRISNRSPLPSVSVHVYARRAASGESAGCGVCADGPDC